MLKYIPPSVAAFFLLAIPSARGQTLDSLLPAGIPGYGTPFSVVADHRLEVPEVTGFQSGAFSAVPSLAASAGYDSAPNEHPGSAVLAATPSLRVSDSLLGLGAYAAANTARYPQDNSQNTSGEMLALGERAVLPDETITLAGGYLRGQETGFALGSAPVSKPVNFTLQNLRASDEISSGPFILKPEISATRFGFPGLAAQNRTDTREVLTTTWAPEGPVQFVLRLGAVQSDYVAPGFNATTDQVLAGFVDTANGLWTFSALAGAAQRRTRSGPALSAPVLEARLDWMPSDLDRLRLELAREIDDPDEISAAAYTLTQAKVSLAHEVRTDITGKFSAEVGNAAYLRSAQRQTLVQAQAGLNWRLGAHLALEGDYAFNDLQGNDQRAANAHVFTLGMTWTP